MSTRAELSNPFQEIIDWLRSESGSMWSEARMQRARGRVMYSGTTRYGSKDIFWWGGIMSIKDDTPDDYLWV